MQGAPQEEDYTEYLGRLLVETHTSVRRLAYLSGVSRRTLENWTDGTVRRPRHWEPVLRVAKALHLSASETDALLRMAGLPVLATLQAAHLAGSQTDLLSTWPYALEIHQIQKKAAKPHGHRLPAVATPFFGREQIRTELTALLRRPDVRLVTLFGLGGVGKTRLALEAARASANRFDHGVYFIALESVHSAETLWEQIAVTLDIPRDPLAPVDELVPDYLGNKRLLLVLDSFEHLSHLAPLVGDLVRRSPELTILVTSRQLLNLRVEYAVPTPGMSLAGDTESPAYKLFLETARRRVPDFTPDSATTVDILAICRAVEGLPLALELAAAWVDILPPARILARLQTGLAKVHQPAADRPARQQSLWSVFDSSYQTLPEDAQQAALRLSVMTGSFSAPAALAIAGCEPETLRTLIDSSLIRRLADGRLTIHALVRQYLSEQAAQIGLTQAELERNYMTYYMGWAAEQGRALREELSAAAVQQLNLEWSHVDCAWWLAADAQRGDLLEAAVDLLIYFEARTAWNEGRAFMRGAQDRLPPDAVRARAVLDEAQAILAVRNFDYIPAMQLAAQALAAFASLGVDPAVDSAGSYARLTQWSIEYGVGQQASAGQTAEGVFQAVGQHLVRHGQITYEMLQASRAALASDWLSATRQYEAVLDRALPDAYHVHNLRLFVGQCLAQLGQVAEARAQFEQAWHGGHALGVFASMVDATFELRYLANDTPTAVECRQALVELANEMSDMATTGSMALHLAVVYLVQGLLAKASLLVWIGFSLLWESTEPPVRAISLFKMAQTYLAFGQMATSQTLLSIALVQPGIDTEMQLTAGGMLGMLGGPLPATEVEPLQILFDLLVAREYGTEAPSTGV
jgi:predicted ATPase